MKIFILDQQLVSPTWIIYKSICLLVNAFECSLHLSLLAFWIYLVSGGEVKIGQQVENIDSLQTMMHSITIGSIMDFVVNAFAFRFLYNNSRKCLLVHITLESISLLFNLTTLVWGAVTFTFVSFAVSAFSLPMQFMYTFMMYQMLVIGDRYQATLNIW